MTDVTVRQNEFSHEYIIADGVLEITLRWPDAERIKEFLDAALVGQLWDAWERYLQCHHYCRVGTYEWSLRRLFPHSINWRKVSDELVDAYNMNEEHGAEIYAVDRALQKTPSSTCRLGFMVWVKETKRAYLMFDNEPSELITGFGESAHIAFMDWMNFNNR